MALCLAVLLASADSGTPLLPNYLLGTWYGGLMGRERMRLDIGSRTFRLSTLDGTGLRVNDRLAQFTLTATPQTEIFHLDLNYSALNGGLFDGSSIQRCLMKAKDSELQIQMPHSLITLPKGHADQQLEKFSAGTVDTIDITHPITTTQRPTMFDARKDIFFYTFHRYNDFVHFNKMRSDTPPALTEMQNSGTGSGALRFKVGDSILANVGGTYKVGEISRVWDAGKPYRVRLVDGTEVWAMEDSDFYVKTRVSGSSQAPLRFKVGDSVLANVEGIYRVGIVSHVWDGDRPYRIRLADNSGKATEVVATEDTDLHVKSLPLPPRIPKPNSKSQSKLRFEVGDAVLANVGGAYKVGTVTRVGDAGHAYRILLVDGSEVWAPEDTDNFLMGARRTLITREMSGEKVCIVGSGNWGSAIARLVGANAAAHDDFQTTVEMFTYEEQWEGRNLTEVINEKHENVKYLPGFPLPENVHATPDLADCAKGATILIFVMPHQFLKGPLETIKANLAPGARAISLIKGIDFDDKGVVLISDLIRNALDIDVSVLMGANVANEVAKEEFCETTIGYKIQENGEILQKLFQAPMFRVAIIQDTVGVELCGALKNIVAIGAGFCDGLGYGGNTKAAIIRIGLLEMKHFCEKYFEGIQVDTFFESCGLADLITTCFGGRNRKCAEAFAKIAAPTAADWDQIEKDILNGQKLQGTLTAKEVHEVLKRTGDMAEFPLFTTIYNIAYEGSPVTDIVKYDQ